MKMKKDKKKKAALKKQIKILKEEKLALLEEINDVKAGNSVSEFSGREYSGKIEKLEESEKKYRLLIEHSLQGLLVLQNFKIVFANSTFEKMSGYSLSELKEMDNETMLKIIHDDDKERVWGYFTDRIAGKPVPDQYHFKGVTKTGGIKIFEGYFKLIEFDKEPAVQGVILDVTDKMQALEQLKVSEERLRLIIESTEDLVAFLDPNKKLLYFNSSDQYRFNTNELTGKKPEEILESESAEKISDEIDKVISSGTFSVSRTQLNLRGTPEWFETHTYPVFSSDSSELTGVSFFARNISQRTITEQQLEKSLKEKEVLLREIHHRVKNNLNIITGLLELQCDSFSDENFKQALTDSVLRVRSMALIHDRLYQHSDISEINLSSYIEELTHYLISAYSIKNLSILPLFDLDELSVSIDQAIPIGIIVNEVITNSIKYAFEDSEGGEIRISLRVNDQHNALLEISDNGKGIPEFIDFNRPETLGLQLIKLLVYQLLGRIELNRENGTLFKISFPIEELNKNKESSQTN